MWCCGVEVYQATCFIYYFYSGLNCIRLVYFYSGLNCTRLVLYGSAETGRLARHLDRDPNSSPGIGSDLNPMFRALFPIYVPHSTQLSDPCGTHGEALSRLIPVGFFQSCSTTSLAAKLAITLGVCCKVQMMRRWRMLARSLSIHVNGNWTGQSRHAATSTGSGSGCVRGWNLSRPCSRLSRSDQLCHSQTRETSKHVPDMFCSEPVAACSHDTWYLHGNENEVDSQCSSLPPYKLLRCEFRDALCARWERIHNSTGNTTMKR